MKFENNNFFDYSAFSISGLVISVHKMFNLNLINFNIFNSQYDLKYRDIQAKRCYFYVGF